MTSDRHGRDIFHIEGEGFVGDPPGTAREAAAAIPFRFSRMGPKGRKLPRGLRVKMARAMTSGANVNGNIPSGFTYLGQFVDHDLTFDFTDVALGDDVSPADLLQGRSPTLDLDNLYGAGPLDAESARFYEDGVRLKVGTTTRSGSDLAKRGFDVPRVGTGGVRARRRANIPDRRNDENLAVAQTHAAMIRFHNRVVDRQRATVPPADRFRRARKRVVLHYQWMLRTDYLPRICDPAVVDDVFTNGRKVFEVGADPLSMPTMPVEFSVAAFRLGHSMVREAYNWNARFPSGQGSLDLLFAFSGTSGDLGGNDTLPSNWIADWRRLYRFHEIQRDDLKPPPRQFNFARRLDTVLVDPLAALPPGSFGGTDADFGTIEANLAFRNLTRATMLNLASGQQMADFMISKGVALTKLTPAQIRNGLDGASLGDLTAAERDVFVAHTPLWFYVLREAELNGGHLTGVGARIVAETFHRAMEGSRFSIIRESTFSPTLGTVLGRFTMTDLLVFAFANKENLLAPLGD
ncbi:peroxidase family protein [Nocardioides sp.]|uniref:peroxidase family protein n=1 Tax=Nocardioides sp. TaxID=35761 RepID=UPI003D0D79BC